MRPVTLHLPGRALGFLRFLMSSSSCVALCFRNLTSELAAPCKDVSLNNDERNSWLYRS